MELILWRHAQAEFGDNDMARRLTPRGHKQARYMAKWLQAQLPKECKILVSPAIRTRETADYLDLPYEIEPRIAPDACVSSLLAASGWPDGHGAVLLVGHQPHLGELAALLLTGEIMPFSIRKSAVWWLTNRTRLEEKQTVLRAVLSPEMFPANMG